MFSQLLNLLPRTEFQALVKRTHAERHARGFTCWGQLVAMLFCQLGRAHSLREICGGLASCAGKLSHLGIKAPSRSTLAYANEHRPWQLYRAVFHELLARCQPLARGRRKFRFKNKLVSLDSSVIDLCATLFDWAKFRRTKGAVTLHLLLDHDGYLPSVAVITDGKRHDVRVARTLRFDPGTILVMDRGYVDYAWFGHLTAGEVFFVTRLKDNALHDVVERRPPPERSQVRRDEVICLTGVDAATKCPHRLRRVEVYDPEQEITLVFLTNHLALGATTIAAIYKDRWQIELFFESSTWCTPSDAMRFQGVTERNRPWWGRWTVSFGYTSLDVRGAQNPGRARASLCCRHVFQSSQPQDGGLCHAEDGGDFTHGHFSASLPFSLTVHRNRMVVSQGADTLRRPALSVRGVPLIAIQDRGDPRVRFDSRQGTNNLHEIVIGDIPMPAGANLLKFDLCVIPALPMQDEAYGIPFTRGDDLFQGDAKETFLVFR